METKGDIKLGDILMETKIEQIDGETETEGDKTCEETERERCRTDKD